MIIKRYIQEEGTIFADFVYDEANHGYLTIVFNLWNIGEVLGVFDQYLRRQWIDQDTFSDTLSKFVDETLKLLRIKGLIILPTLSSYQMEAWEFIMEHRLYIADAIQIVNHKQLKADYFASGDKHLSNTAERLGLRIYDPEKEEKIIKSIQKQMSN
jgi:predicted nucleic acid-binding protein